MITLAEKLDSPLTINSSYDIGSYLESVAGNENERCRYCFELRLSKTAEEAVKRGYEYFTTTLLISPHQKHITLKETGDKVACETKSSFLYADLRKRYSDSRHITKQMELYRQRYCGCIYSKWESFFDNKQAGRAKA